MATALREWTKEEVRAVVRFLWAQGTQPVEIHHEIEAVYGPNVMNVQSVRTWCRIMKKHLRGHRFQSDDVKHAVKIWLRDQVPNFYRQGLESWITRLDKCLNRKGNYVEK